MKRSLHLFLPAALLAIGLTLFQGIAARAVEDDINAREEQAMKAALAQVAPSVVRIETVGGLERIGSLLIGTAPTTGLIVSKDGYIISSAFNFVQEPTSILVTLPSGTRVPAQRVATDHSRMLVLLKVKADDLPVPVAAPLKEVRVGQWAIAVGRTFEGNKANMSIGIVSAVDRVWGKAVQTDAKISPNNYGGPLIDIHGRVLGVLSPLSPQANDEISGVDWYDSGIGFAVPLERINQLLPTLKEGKDLHAGLMGISLRGTDIYADAAIIGACQPNSPSYIAGLKPGDEIVEIEGHKITRQAELKQQLGDHNAGDKIALVALRGKERIEKQLELVAKLPPYDQPFLGLLPMRNASSEGAIVVRYVYPGSGADKAGLQRGDRITTFEGQPVKNRAALVEQLGNWAPQHKSPLEIVRGDKTLKLEVELGVLPLEVPAELPPGNDASAPAAAGGPATGIVHIQIPEIKNECAAYVPENYDLKIPHGLLVWLPPPGPFKEQDFIDRWKQAAADRHLIVLASRSANATKWERTEVEFVRKTIDDVRSKYNIDPTRIVMQGQEGAGTLAYLMAFAFRDLVRGVVTTDATLPSGFKPPPTDPVQRLAIYLAHSKKSAEAHAIQAGLKSLRALKYPVTEKDLGESARAFSADEIDELALWIDSLDRL